MKGLRRFVAAGAGTLVMGAGLLLPAVPAGAAPAGTVPTAYFTNSQADSVTVVHGKWSVWTIHHVGLGPVGIAIAPNRRTAYVADYGFYKDVQSTVTPIDLLARKAEKPIQVGIGPMAIAVTPDGKYAVVTLQGTPDAPGHQMVRITLASGEVSGPVEVGTNPESVAVSADSRTAYVAAFSDAKVTPVDLTVTPPEAQPSIRLPLTAPRAIALTRDGSLAYVADAENAALIPINLATRQPGPPLDLVCRQYGDPGCTPTALSITGRGNAIYIAAAGSGDVMEVALPSLRKVRVLPAGGYPDAVAVARGWLYCANGASDSTSIFVARVPVRTPPTGPYPAGVAVVP